MSSKNTKSESSTLVNNPGVFPPVLPTKYRKLIDGVKVTGIRIEYTQFSYKVLVILKDGNTRDFDEYIPSISKEKKDKKLHDTISLYRKRIEARNLDIEMPDCTDLKEVDTWVKSLDKDKRKLLLMNASNFRSYKRKDAQSQDSATTSGQNDPDEK